MPVEKVSYLFCSWKTRERDPLKDLVKLFLPPLVPAATLWTSAIYYVPTRKVHYVCRAWGWQAAGLALHPAPLAAPVLSDFVSPESLGDMVHLFICQNARGLLAQQAIPSCALGSF